MLLTCIVTNNLAIYGNQLAKVIHQMIVIGQVSLLGRDLEIRSTDPVVADSRSLRHKKSGTHFDWNWKGFDGTGLGDDDDNSESSQSNYISAHIETEGVKSPASETEDTIYIERQDPFADSSGRVKMLELLEAWEEPELDPGKPVCSHVGLLHSLKVRMFLFLTYSRSNN